MNIEKVVIFKTIFTKIKKGFLFIFLIFFGYSICEIYHYIKEAKKTKIQKVRTMNETSVAINEREELMLIDRLTGEYEVYQDSVGKSIFELYAIMFQSKYEIKSKY